MPTTNPVLLKAKQQRAKLRERQRRERLIHLLGGRCTECGSTYQLQLDHTTGFRGARRSILEYEKAFRERRLRVLCAFHNQQDAAMRTNYKRLLKSKGVL